MPEIKILQNRTALSTQSSSYFKIYFNSPLFIRFEASRERYLSQGHFYPAPHPHLLNWPKSPHLGLSNPFKSESRNNKVANPC